MSDKNVNKVIYGNEVLLDLSSDTVAPEKMLVGTTAHDKSGKTIIGTMPSSGGYPINGVERTYTVVGDDIQVGDFINTFEQSTSYKYLTEFPSAVEVPERSVYKVEDDVYIAGYRRGVYAYNLADNTTQEIIPVTEDDGFLAQIDDYHYVNVSFLIVDKFKYFAYKNIHYNATNKTFTIDEEYTVTAKYFAFDSRHHVLQSIIQDETLYLILELIGSSGNISVRIMNIYCSGDELNVRTTTVLRHLPDGVRAWADSFYEEGYIRVALKQDVETTPTVLTPNLYEIDINTMEKTHMSYGKLQCILKYDNSSYYYVMYSELDNGTYELVIADSSGNNYNTGIIVYGLGRKDFGLRRINNQYSIVNYKVTGTDKYYRQLIEITSDNQYVIHDREEYYPYSDDIGERFTYLGNNNFISYYFGKLNPSDTENCEIIRFQTIEDGEIKDTKVILNGVILAENYKYIRGVAIESGSDGDEITCVIPFFETMQKVSSDVKADITTFTVNENDGHLYCETDDDSITYSIDVDGHIIAEEV